VLSACREGADIARVCLESSSEIRAWASLELSAYAFRGVRRSPIQTLIATTAWPHRSFCCRIDGCSLPGWQACLTSPQ